MLHALEVDVPMNVHVLLEHYCGAVRGLYQIGEVWC